MNEMTLQLVKKHLQERMRKRMEEHPEQLEENLIDAVCLDCINLRLMLEGGKDELLSAVSEDLDVLDKFLGQVEDDLRKMTEETEEADAEE